MTKLLMLKPAKLLTHPRNMRRFYPSEQVREMANSILAAKGVVQPLIIVEADQAHKYFVVDGNMRLAAAKLLEDECPALECKVVEQAEAEQLLSMVVANEIRYDVDPVSEALHYKALEKEGLSVREISKRTGVYESRISNRKILADLPEPIQRLIAEGKLHHDPRVAHAFLALRSETAVKLAGRLAQNPNIKIKTIIAACEKLVQHQPGKTKLKRPAVELSGADRTEKKKAVAAEIRTAAKETCHSCNQYEGKLRKADEPAWSMVVHAADETCNVCPLKEMQKICASCPAVQLLRKLANA